MVSVFVFYFVLPILKPVEYLHPVQLVRWVGRDHLPNQCRRSPVCVYMVCAVAWLFSLNIHKKHFATGGLWVYSQGIGEKTPEGRKPPSLPSPEGKGKCRLAERRKERWLWTWLFNILILCWRLFMYICVHVCVPVNVLSWGAQWGPKDDVWSLRIGGVGDCELLNVYARIWIQVQLTEQQALVTAEPALQPYFCFVWDKIAVALLS